MDEMNQTLKKIDRKMKTFYKKNRFLYDAWKATYTVDDTGSRSSAITGSVGTGETKVIANITYNSSSPITIDLSGSTVDLDFMLLKNGVLVGSIYTVASGTVVSTTLGNIAPDGNELRTKNMSNTSAGVYKLKVL